MIAPSSGAPTLVQPPSPAGVPKSGDLAMSTLDYDEARPRHDHRHRPRPARRCAPISMTRWWPRARPAATASWRLAPADPSAPASTRLRLDRLTKDGKPVARLELPFDACPGAGGQRATVAAWSSCAATICGTSRAPTTAQGMHHTVIYGANKEQIRDPDLIYPGQVLSLPKVN